MIPYIHGVRYCGSRGSLDPPVFRENQWIFKIYNGFLIILTLWTPSFKPVEDTAYIHRKFTQSISHQLQYVLVLISGAMHDYFVQYKIISVYSYSYSYCWFQNCRCLIYHLLACKFYELDTCVNSVHVRRACDRPPGAYGRHPEHCSRAPSMSSLARILVLLL